MPKKKMACKHCKNLITPDTYSPTGYTHSGGTWEGKRCQDGLTGATPKDK